MNIMLVSVIERRKEIGIRMAVGATPGDIQGLFVTESVMLSFAGGIIGLLLGLAVSYVLSLTQHWDFLISQTAVGLGLIVSIFIGVFFGYYPALQASKLDPIETLHGE